MINTAFLLLLAIPGTAPAVSVAQEPGVTLEKGLDLAERDARVGFDTRSGGEARLEFARMRTGDPILPATMVVVGASRVLGLRSRLIEATGASDLDERCAGVLALGEMGKNVGDAVEVLIDLADGASGQTRDCALVALSRCGTPEAVAALDRFAGEPGNAGRVAQEIRDYPSEPAGTTTPAAWRRLYGLRWEGAQLYGTIDGQPWSRVRLEELFKDERFLSAVVYESLRGVSLPGVRDHLLEALVEGRGAARITAAVTMMPLEVERLIDSGVWRPRHGAEWRQLVEDIVTTEQWRLFPSTLKQATAHQPARALAAGLLQREGNRYEEILLTALRSEDARVRADAVISIGAAGLTDYVTVLRELSEDPEPWVSANAMCARLRMGEVAASGQLIEYVELPPERRNPVYLMHLFQALDRAAPDPEVLDFLDQLAPTIEGDMRVAVDGIRVRYGRRADARDLREALRTMDPRSPDSLRAVQALGTLPDDQDLEALARVFPYEGAKEINVALAVALVRGGHRSADPVLAAAVWELPWTESILAAGVAFDGGGARLLEHWARRPPRGVGVEELRRIGYAIGEWGGLESVESLRQQLGTAAGAEEPVLQGALLGALASRTR